MPPARPGPSRARSGRSRSGRRRAATEQPAPPRWARRQAERASPDLDRPARIEVVPLGAAAVSSPTASVGAAAARLPAGHRPPDPLGPVAAAVPAARAPADRPAVVRVLAAAGPAARGPEGGEGSHTAAWARRCLTPARPWAT